MQNIVPDTVNENTNTSQVSNGVFVITAYISTDKKTKIVLAKPTGATEGIDTICKMLGISNVHLIAGEIRQMRVEPFREVELQLVSEYDGYK